MQIHELTPRILTVLSTVLHLPIRVSICSLANNATGKTSVLDALPFRSAVVSKASWSREEPGYPP